MKREFLRPAVHAGALGFVFLEPVLGRWGMAGTAAAVTLLNLLVLPRTALGKSLRREGEPLVNGQVTYPLAVAAAYALFPYPGPAVAWAVMALADPAASVLASSEPWNARLPWNRRKSVMGTFSFLLVAEIAAVAVLMATHEGPIGYDARMMQLHIAAVLALVGAIVESLPLPIDDNLPIVLAVGGAFAYAARFLT